MSSTSLSLNLSRCIRPLLVYVIVSVMGVGSGCASAIFVTAALAKVQPLSPHTIVAPLNGAATRLPSALPSFFNVSTIASYDPAVRWSAIGGSLLQARLNSLSVSALRRAVASQRDSLTLRGALGEAIVLSSGGEVVDAARREFEFVLSIDPNDLIARYYMAHWLLQNGKPKPALVKFVGLMRTVGSDPVWSSNLWQVMPQVAEQVGINRLTLEALCVAGM
jgi:hypothetical protein